MTMRTYVNEHGNGSDWTDWISDLVEHIDGENTPLDLSLDLQPNIKKRRKYMEEVEKNKES